MVGTAQGRLCPPYEDEPETFPPAGRISPMRIPFLTLGLLAFAIGLLWIGQGTGFVAWPRSSFMISQMQWAWYGAALAAVGLGLMWLSRR
ncbi:MAG: hypothetical protein JWR89_979 [Tardiphaga sp.]|nr:hypothetical protein [Tardiphaga sp.]